MKIELVHVDTCLPGYWSGHHKAHIQIPVYNGMALDEIKKLLLSELNEGAVMGNDRLAELLAADYSSLNAIAEFEAIEANSVAISAINAITPNDPNRTEFFTDLEQQDDDCDCDSTVYAYFVFVEKE